MKLLVVLALAAIAAAEPEAEAKADPYLLYGGYGLGYYGLGHRVYYGKREAEPKAEAEPYYGYYGLGYHGLGYRTYGYGHGIQVRSSRSRAQLQPWAQPQPPSCHSRPCGPDRSSRDRSRSGRDRSLRRGGRGQPLPRLQAQRQRWPRERELRAISC